MPVANITSTWVSGNLIFYEVDVGRSVTGDVLTLETSAVKVGGTSQDIDFQFYATGSKSFIIDAGAGTITATGFSNVFGTSGGKIVDAASSVTIYGGDTSGDKLYLYGTSAVTNFGSVNVGNFADSYANPLGAGAIGLGNATNGGIRAFIVSATDGGIIPTKRIESSCHAFVQRLDWTTTALSATALEGVFYGGFDLISTADNINVSGCGGWIYLTDESGVTGAGTAPVVGAASGKIVYVNGLESWVALPASVDIKATGKICGLKLSNNFLSGMSVGSGHSYNIYTETVDSVGYEYFWGTNQVGNGLSVNAEVCAVATAWALAIDVNGTPGYIPVFSDKSWGS